MYVCMNACACVQWRKKMFLSGGGGGGGRFRVIIKASRLLHAQRSILARVYKIMYKFT